MIPKRAIFCWSGDKPMSWLRQQSIESFRVLNPGWEIDVVNCTDGWPEGAGFRLDALRSDFARYRVLYEQGGVYFDTDIAFVKPIPDSWLMQSIFAPLSSARYIYHIACLGGVQGHPFWRSVADRCRKRAATGVPLECQAFGTSLLQRTPAPDEMGSIPIEAILCCRFDEIERLWWAGDLLKPQVPRDAIGVHWYGGDRLSQDMEPLFTEEGMPPSLVAEAVKVTLETSVGLQDNRT